MEKVKTIALNMTVIVALAIVLIWGQTWFRQWHQFDRGEAALAAGDCIAAIAGYESAIHMYTPGSPLLERAAKKLWTIGEGSERTGDLEMALIAYRSLRSSFYSTRWLFQPGQGWIYRCDGRIAEILKRQGYVPQSAQ